MNTFLYSVIFCLITTVTFSQNVEWQIFTGSNSGLPDEYVLTLAIESNGTKWIGTGNGGLASFDGSNWNVYNSTNSPLPYNWVSAIDLSGDGELWIGTFGAGLAKLEGSVWSIYTQLNTGVPISTIRSVATRGGVNVKLFGTSYEGLAVFDGTDWSIFNTSNSGIPYNTVGAVAIENSNLWWIGTDSGDLARFDGDWTIYNSGNSGLPFSPIYSIAIDSAETKWIGTAVGLTSFDGSLWTTYTSSNSGFPGGQVTGIAVDSINNIWLATFGVTGGLVKFDGTNWTLYNISNTGIWNYLRSIAIEPNGNVWVGTNGYGLAVLNENGLTSVEQISGEPNNFQLSQNYPNPFNPSTTISFSILTESFVKLEIFNSLGEKVSTLVSETLTAGKYKNDWNAAELSSGIYFYKLQAGSFAETKKMILLK